jgi:polysaccharide biosynthesis/export protein
MSRARLHAFALGTLLCMSAFFTGCAGGTGSLPLLPNDQHGAVYLLGAGDSLRITVFGEPDLSGTFKISDNGALVMPLVGQVSAQGLSVPELQKRLVGQLKDMTVLTAVAIAGGFTFRASQDEVSVTRKRNGAPIEARARRDARVLPGDVVYVFERHF